jgi:hypothetical protein
VHKESFVAGQHVFRSEPNYFGPLEFYVALFQKELLPKNPRAS